MAKVSVNLVTYNSADTIATCLESLLAQRNADFCIHLIDNASTDNTVNLVHQMGFDIRLNSQNLGYATAHNQGIEQTDSQYVLTLNPDVRLEPDFISSLTATLDEQQSVGSASGCLLRVDSLDEQPLYVDSTGLIMRQNRHQRLRYEKRPVDERPTEPTLIFGPDGAAAFYRRAMLEDTRVCGEIFDSDFFMQKEDVDIAWRAQLRGWSSVYVPSAIARHIRSFRPGQRQRVTPQMRYYGVRNRYLLMLKNDVRQHFLSDLWAIAAYDVMIFCYILLREPSSWQAFKAVWLMRQKMMAKRRAIQNRRVIGWREISRWFPADSRCD